MSLYENSIEYGTNCHVLHTSKLLYIPRREQRKESIIVYALVRRKSKREGTRIED